MSTVTELKHQWSHFLCQPTENYIPKGLPTEHELLNRFLPWGGLPKGGVTLIQAQPGVGATSFWLDVAKNITQQKRWAAWMNGSTVLCPTSLYQKGVDLDHFICLTPKNMDVKKWFWLLQELISHQIFDTIGCDINGLALKDFHLRKLVALTEREKLSLVFFQSQNFYLQRSHFELILHFGFNQLTVEKVSQRPTPKCFSLNHLTEVISALPTLGAASDETENNRLILKQAIIPFPLSS